MIGVKTDPVKERAKQQVDIKLNQAILEITLAENKLSAIYQRTRHLVHGHPIGDQMEKCASNTLQLSRSARENAQDAQAQAAGIDTTELDLLSDMSSSGGW